jgi:hypothetical protein
VVTLDKFSSQKNTNKFSLKEKKNGILALLDAMLKTKIDILWGDLETIINCKIT